jgi:hypothetical protein
VGAGAALSVGTGVGTTEDGEGVASEVDAARERAGDAGALGAVLTAAAERGTGGAGAADSCSKASEAFEQAAARPVTRSAMDRRSLRIAEHDSNPTISRCLSLKVCLPFAGRP